MINSFLYTLVSDDLSLDELLALYNLQRQSSGTPDTGIDSSKQDTSLGEVI